MRSPPMYDAFAIAAPGLSPLVATELGALGIQPAVVGDAGVAFTADAAGLYRANLHLRVASRVIVRAARFRAAHFSELEKGARGVSWERWIAAGAACIVRVTSRKSRLYHTGGVAERVHASIARVVPGVQAVTLAEDDVDHEAHLVIVRIDRDACTISVDSSGPLLHRRGYRQAVAKAPLRETLAAAVLRGVGYDPALPMVDPCCGSGTIPIEAAMIARCIPPGLGRAFAFERWPEFDAVAERRVRDEARAGVLATAPAAIHGSDRDPGAIAAARSNAQRAGVAGDIVFERRPLSGALAPAGGRGVLVVNPPYGERLGEAAALRDLYAALGHLARNAFRGWKVAVLASDASLVAEARLPLESVLTTSNGGIQVTLYATPAGFPSPP